MCRLGQGRCKSKQTCCVEKEENKTYPNNCFPMSKIPTVQNAMVGGCWIMISLWHAGKNVLVGQFRGSNGEIPTWDLCQQLGWQCSNPRENVDSCSKGLIDCLSHNSLTSRPRLSVAKPKRGNPFSATARRVGVSAPRRLRMRVLGWGSAGCCSEYHPGFV